MSTFEHKAKRQDGGKGSSICSEKGTRLAERKSRGKNLNKAVKQAKDHLQRVPQHELPKGIMVSDCDELRLHDAEEDTTASFRLSEPAKNVPFIG